MSHKINNKWHIFSIYCSELQEVLESAGFWATVCKTVRHAIGPLSCLSVLSVTLVYCGQMVGWIKMKLCMQVGLSPSHTVLDWDRAPAMERGTAAPHFRNLQPTSILAKWLDGSR